ncbi:MAG: iron ABC transporter permease, partial [Candidatus Omnitrophica bacterium]|nr:iron ABC transporter permease [Candidatus Omnitrophota bacterium]
WGSLEVYDMKLLSVVALIVFAGIAAIFFFSQDMNAMSVGEEYASHVGVKTEEVKKILFFITSLVSASIVCVSGIIGFVGLIIPHIMRLAVGPDHRVLIPCTCVAASAFMILCDMMGRTLLAPLEIPIGVITAVVGAPIFIILLKRKQRIR